MRIPAALRRRLGVRLRSALAAGLVVVVASLLAGAALVVTARSLLLDNVNSSLTDRARQVAVDVAAGDSEGLAATLRPAAPERIVIQVVNAAGLVVAASGPVDESPPLTRLRPAAGRHEFETRRLRIGHESSYRIVATGVATSSGSQTVIVAQSLDLVDDSIEAIIGALALSLPVLALVVGAATFVFVGRTLRPVEAMRRQATSISARNLDARLPVPETDDEIAALAVTMNTMLDRIEAATAAQRRFVADASHELRSPLATIHANADLLAAADLAEKPARSAGRIRQESRRMARLVDDLLLLARIDDQQLQLRSAEVDLDDLVFAERERVATDHPALRLDGGVEPVRVAGDLDRLHRVLRNLTDNTVRHARERVTINLAADGDQAVILIGNDGVPIAAADRERIFDRFVRLDDSRARRDGGAGLGLAIARDIVAAHGGTLAAAELTAGAAMVIRLPLAYHDRAPT